MECFMEVSHNMHLNKARMGKSLSLECVESCSVDLQGAGRRRWRQRTRRAHDYDGCREAREIYGITQSHHHCYASEKRRGVTRIRICALQRTGGQGVEVLLIDEFKGA